MPILTSFFIRYLIIKSLAKTLVLPAVPVVERCMKQRTLGTRLSFLGQVSPWLADT